MRGKIGNAHEYSYIVLNWLKRRGIEKKSEVSDASQDANQRVIKKC